MNQQAAIDMLRRYYAAWGTGEPDRVAEFFCDDAVFEDLAFEAKFEGLDGVRTFAAITYGGVPDFKVEPDTIIVDGDRAATSWVMQGTHSGDLPNLPASGRSFQVRASSIIQLRDDKILQMLDFWNPATFQKQVGLL